uniref:Gp5/Type VI secretion system Vgr protein OB-fold domain-containing protein n=1 Tax=Candidatus Kentrum sp. FM TaxID=2126340 RepID=A0A450VLL2_9GAMM|nr:MAG: hypothetical protein BECKFM1743A_GA0114220_1000339 [Candidatus Kentron sp. FM]VFJ43735.1 MAG: hypothetical protein BECKFM1743C_GA0114222_1000339 [Candidatus Kentron sp. FM]VFK05706.1 MAG: hypothetical protein BECKFM1743B_GA0114221_1000339 [Candidatus Kentron sp. FM]
MDEAILALIRRNYPELTARFHLPIFARVTGITEPQKDGDLADDFRPRYAVDVEVLQEDGKPDPDFPGLLDVPLPVPMGGPEQGIYGKPAIGTWVEIGFAYGSPNRPFVRCVLPHGLSLPALEESEHRWQQCVGRYQWITTDGSWYRVTEQTIIDDAYRIERWAHQLSEAFKVSETAIEGNHTVDVGGVERRKADSGMEIQTGGQMAITALEGIQVSSGSDVTETIARRKDSIAKDTQRIRVDDGGLIWLGNRTENTLRLLSALMQVVINLAEISKRHTHGGQTPDQFNEYQQQESTGIDLKARQDSMTE